MQNSAAHHMFGCCHGAVLRLPISLQASSAKRQRSNSLLKRTANRAAEAPEGAKEEEAAEGAKEAAGNALEDSDASGDAGRRPQCINLLDDSDDEDASSPQLVSFSDPSLGWSHRSVSRGSRPRQSHCQVQAQGAVSASDS